MKIWVIRDLEPIPTDPNCRRLMRTNMLCAALTHAGHDVTWFTSTFDHYLKRQRSKADIRIVISPSFVIEVLACHGYRRHVGLARILHNRQFARRFRQRFLKSDVRPDLLVTDIPTTEAAATVVALGKQQTIPTVVSVRDIWPDSFADQLPPLLRPFAAPVVEIFNRQAAFALRHATSVISISQNYLEWGQRKGQRSPGLNDRVVQLGYLPVALTRDDRTSILNRLGINSDDFNVTFVGSWGRTADLEIVAESAELLRDRADIRFVICGEPRDNPRAAAELEKLPNVLLPGWLNKEEIAAVLGATSIGLLPYRFPAPHGLPNKAFEYMAYGVHQVSTLTGELEALYRNTGAGECLPRPDAISLADAIAAHAQGRGLRRSRDELRSTFESRFSAQPVYTEMARHILDLVPKPPDQPPPSKSANSSRMPLSTNDAVTIRTHCMSTLIARQAEAWFKGELDHFEPDGDRSVIIAHPENAALRLKIKGAGLKGNRLQFDRWHRSGPKAPLFDFEGRMMEDVASGHDNALVGGASFQQVVVEHEVAARLTKAGRQVVPCLGYGSVTCNGRASWFSVFEWRPEWHSHTMPHCTVGEFADANIAYGRDVIELASEHGLVGYFWYVSAPQGTLVIKDVHPFYAADPLNMSRISWTMHVFFALHTVSLTAIHSPRVTKWPDRPHDLQAYPFRYLVPDATRQEHEDLRRVLVAPYMRGIPADFDPLALGAVLREHRLTRSIMDRCPTDYAAMA